MPLTRLANAVIDAVSENPEPVRREIAKYLGSDLLFYRAEAPVKLIDKQSQAWDPVLAWAREAFGANFKLAQGVVHVAQPAEAVEALQSVIPRDPWRLAAVSSITTLTGSALLALAIAQGAIDIDSAWTAAHVDEDWQMAQWGRDELALERRAYREAEFQAAVSVLVLSAKCVDCNGDGHGQPRLPYEEGAASTIKLIQTQCPVGSPRRPAS